MNLRLNYLFLGSQNIFASHKVSKILKTLLHVLLLVLVKILSSDNSFFSSSPSSNSSSASQESASISRVRRAAKPISTENLDALYSRMCTYYFHKLDEKNGVKEMISHPILRSTFTFKVDEECEAPEESDMSHEEKIIEV